MGIEQSPLEKKTIASLAALYIVRMLGLFMALPVLTLYGQDYAGATPQTLGLALGIYGLTQALLQIPYGSLSDRFGRKPMITVGLLVFAAGSAVAAMADSVWGLIIGRGLQGAGAIASVIMALVADTTAEHNRTKAMAMLGVSIGVAFALALIIGPLVTSVWGLSGVFGLTFCLALVGLVLLWTIVPSAPVIVARRDALAMSGLVLKTLRQPELLRLNLGIFVLHFSLMAMFVVMPTLLDQNLSLHRDEQWKVYLPVISIAFIGMMPFIILAEKKRKMKPVFIGAVGLLLLIQLMLVGLPLTPTVLVGGLFLFFFSFNLLEATLPSLMSKTAPVATKGTASGIYSTCQFLGTFLGGVSGGLMVSYAGPSGVFALSACFLVLWLLAAYTMEPPRYLSSVLVALNGKNFDSVEAPLRGLPGVAEVALVPEEDAVYLKVDSQLFDRSMMEPLGLR